MEIRRRWDARRVVTIAYLLALAVYLIVGLQPAEATHYEVDATLEIPAIDLTTDVTELELVEHRLATPDTIVGSYSRAENKTLLIGHSSTVFTRLDEIDVGDYIIYGGARYKVVERVTLAKAEISMMELLSAAEEDTIIVMTCAGESLGGGDASHRLLVTAVAEN